MTRHLQPVPDWRENHEMRQAEARFNREQAVAELLREEEQRARRRRIVGTVLFVLGAALFAAAASWVAAS